MVTRKVPWRALWCAVCWAGASALAQAAPASAVAQSETVADLQRRAETLLSRARTRPDARAANQAEAAIQRALNLDRRAAKSWELLAWSEMSRHRFREALTALDRAQALAPHSAIGLGLRADAQVELGRYPEALATVQALLDRFPGLPAYSRAAHLRFLHGDTEGAIALMQNAAQAGRPRSEEAAWVLLQLSDLQLQAGRVAAAEQAALTAAANFSPLAANHAQLGRVRIAQGRLEAAAESYEQAWRIQPNPEYAIALHDLAQRMNRPDEARRLARLIDALARLDEANGGLNRRAFAFYFADQAGDAARALRLAQAEARARPDIYSEDALAWALYRVGKTGKAVRHMERALALGSRDAMLLAHGVAIFEAAGDSAHATALRGAQPNDIVP